ncbi:MAG: S8 family serine peptidase [Paucibacter sp.]|nr:S8 family serine peptidase [Roseateles sp.]
MRRWLAVLFLLVLTGCATPADEGAAAPAGGAFIVLAIDDLAEPAPLVGATPRARYSAGPGYAGGLRAAAVAGQIATEHQLHEQAFWRIAPLQWRCMLYRLPAGVDAADLLARLALDPRVRLAQPLNEFETLAAPGYNDPYLPLQTGLTAIEASAAQQWTRGEGQRVALIDTGVDADHPDLAGRIKVQRDFGQPRLGPGGERHGTEMAGVIAAVANNGLGIVGVAPGAQLLVYRACWQADVEKAGPGPARCNSFTLAQALGAALADEADIINLSLGGPADPLLARLLSLALARGAIVVGAVPPSGRLDGFPAGVPGVLAVSSAEAAVPGTLVAPGRDILSTQPGGHYGYASGSSLATAHVSGALALLRSAAPGLSGEQALALLAGSVPIKVCAALRRLRPNLPPNKKVRGSATEGATVSTRNGTQQGLMHTAPALDCQPLPE